VTVCDRVIRLRTVIRSADYGRDFDPLVGLAAAVRAFGAGLTSACGVRLAARACAAVR